MSVVISFTGLIGAGKSVCSKYVSSSLIKKGYPVYYIRFRFISWKSFFQKKKQLKNFTFKSPMSKASGNAEKRRGKNFELKSPLRFLLYMPYFLWKVYLLFFLIKLRYKNDIVIVNRFIYDNLANFRLSAQNNFLFKLFLKLIPRPNLPFILYADFDTISEARQEYAHGFIQKNILNYQYLKEILPNIIAIETNSVENKIEEVLSIIISFLSNQANEEKSLVKSDVSIKSKV